MLSELKRQLHLKSSGRHFMDNLGEKYLLILKGGLGKVCNDSQKNNVCSKVNML